jgi:hypothetical protein
VASVQLVMSKRARISSSSWTLLAARPASLIRGSAQDPLSGGMLEIVMSCNVRLLAEVNREGRLPVPWHLIATVGHGEEDGPPVLAVPING